MNKTENKNTHSILEKSEFNEKQSQSGHELHMRALDDHEVLSVAGGPEVDVEVGGGGG
ncbi:hypothetical protein ACO0K9_08920 [Undibacterium sp. Ji50W]|uniref:hypothetical protein n=1 Tax=Undibacterium sp. Ji50W TaxID=3413041 RepID=UPI003BF239D0